MKIKKKTVIIIVAAASLLVLALFLSFQLSRQIAPDNKYHIITKGTVHESVALDGYVFRNDNVIYSDVADAVPTRSEGEKVAAGATVAKSGESEIKTDISGYFYSRVDGREGDFSLEAATKLTPGMLGELTSKSASDVSGAVGKIAAECKWRLAADTKYENFSVGELYFVQIGDENIPMMALYISDVENGAYTVVFECDKGQSAAADRQITASVDVAHTGYVVPSAALQGKDGERYIYLFERGRAVKVSVSVVYDGGEYAVVESESEIIGKVAISGGGQNAGKVLK